MLVQVCLGDKTSGGVEIQGVELDGGKTYLLKRTEELNSFIKVGIIKISKDKPCNLPKPKTVKQQKKTKSSK